MLKILYLFSYDKKKEFSVFDSPFTLNESRNTICSQGLLESLSNEFFAIIPVNISVLLNKMTNKTIPNNKQQ
mgnify:CR=1 FL=1